MAKEVVVTREGYKLEQERKTCATVKLKGEVADKIKVARGYGDLSENAEYDAAKEGRLLWRPASPIWRLPQAGPHLDESELSHDTASIGSMSRFWPGR